MSVKTAKDPAIAKPAESPGPEAETPVTGVVIGLLVGFDDDLPLVVFPGNPQDRALPARSLAALEMADAGSEVALLFEDGAPDRPLIVGRIVDPVRARGPAPDGADADADADPAADATPTVVHDGQTTRITAKQRIELRVGKSAIVMEADGHITIRGKHLVSQASGSNRIRGASVNLN